jgi:hypothetical protein
LGHLEEKGGMLPVKKLKDVALEGVSISAAINDDGTLFPVGDMWGKIIALATSKEAELYGIIVLIIAENQDQVPGMDLSDRYRLLPRPETVSLDSGASFRTLESLLVIRCSTLTEAIQTLYELQSRTVLMLLKRPHVIGDYLLTGTWSWLMMLFLLLPGGWYFLGSPWFLLVGILELAIGIVIAQWEIRRVEKHKNPALILPPDVHRTIAGWRHMALVAKGSHRSTFLKNICAWVDNCLKRQQMFDSRQRLADLPQLWRTSLKYRFRLIVLTMMLVGLLSNFQYLLRETLPPYETAFLGGTSHIATPTTDLYVPVEAKTEPGGTRVLRTTLGFQGWIRLSVIDKPHTVRFLRITSSAQCFLRAHAEGSRQNEVTIPIKNARATFYYGIQQSDIWNVDFKIELLDYFGGLLREATLYGYREPIIIPSSMWQKGEK